MLSLDLPTNFTSNLDFSGGLNDPFLPLSTILPAHGVMVRLSPKGRFHPLMTRSLVEPPKPSYTSALALTAGLLKDSLDMVKYGLFSRLAGDEQVNLPTASACCAVPPAPESDGCGIVKTMSGPRCTVNTKGGGFMSTLVRRCGITQGLTQKVSISVLPIIPRLTFSPSRLEP